jgi:hypothetical protein
MKYHGHVTVKRWLVKRKTLNEKLTDRVTHGVTEAVSYCEELVPVALEEINAADRAEEVCLTDIEKPA